ncbi:MAG: phosphodiester glycosidase family protein [Vallitalea sp.]|nr:phosphodiester glycosidase family protein [Vallitalea sp.]
MKGIIRRVLVVCIVIGVVLNSNYVYGSSIDNVLYQSSERETISTGVIYEKNVRLTEAGWVDVHILEVDLTNPYVKLDVIRNTDVFGKKESLTSMANQNGVIGAINGDFFNMTKNPTDILGFEYETDGIKIGRHLLNAGDNTQASLFTDSNNIPFIDYMKIKLKMSSEKNDLYVYSFNKVTSFKYPTYIDKASMSDTKQIDDKHEKLYKIVVENDIITYLSEGGENVSVPENGYVIVMNEETASYIFKVFPVGLQVKFDIQSNIDLDSINLAISGGGKIISNGQLVTEGMVVQGNSRHPRTAIGYNKEKDKLYMVVVDGRRSSIGANHEELGNILLEKGLYDAIHLDGGGSSTLVARELGRTNVTVFNTPSDGTQRRIPNGIGVKSTAPVSDLFEIKIIADTTRVFKDMPITFDVIGYDKYYNPITIDKTKISWQTSNITGKWEENKFYPNREGKVIVKAYFNGISSEIDIECMADPISLEINSKYHFLDYGETTNFKILGIDKDGYRGEINSKNVTWELVDSSLGYFDKGQFIAGNKNGYSLIKGHIGDTTVYGYIIVGKEKVLVDSFEGNIELETKVYPEKVMADSRIQNIGYKGNSVKLAYYFGQSTDTQAAYAHFTNPYTFDRKLDGLGLWVKGNNLNHWLRGRIIDADGKKHNISFASVIDWNGWKYVEAKIPNNLSYPIKLDRVYVASLYSPQGHICELNFDELTAIYSFDSSNLMLPKKEIYDPLNNSLVNDPEMKMSVFGSTGSKNRLLDNIIQQSVVKQMDEISDISLFVGDTDISDEDITNKKVIWDDTYKITDFDNLRIINLATSKRGMRLTDKNQWKTFIDDLNNTRQNHIFITVDNNPLDPNGFIDKREGKLFHSILKEYREKTNKNIFVINGSGYDFNIEYIEGIRYMDINGLWYKVYDDNKVDLDNKIFIINFNISADNISYNIINAYKK